MPSPEDPLLESISLVSLVLLSEISPRNDGKIISPGPRHSSADLSSNTVTSLRDEKSAMMDTLQRVNFLERVAVLGVS